MKIITIDSRLSLPKYKQIVLSVETAIAEKRLKKNDRLPSVNKVVLEFSISRDTVLLAYDELKKRGIIYARMGKGYYVKSEEFSFEQRIFLLFDEFNTFKEDLYNSFMEGMDHSAQVDIFFHYFSPQVFKKLIHENNGDYSKYIIMPTTLKEAPEIIKTLPKNDVYILDQTNEELKGYPSIHQNFVKDTFNGLLQAKARLKNYKKLLLVFPSFRQPPGMKQGFIQFCSQYGFTHEVLGSLVGHDIKKGNVYIIPNDRDLVQILEQAREKMMITGTDIGVISYNDTPLKRVVGNGITTISTDFKAMGHLLAKMVLQQKKEQAENSSSLILRSSL